MKVRLYRARSGPTALSSGQRIVAPEAGDELVHRLRETRADLRAHVEAASGTSLEELVEEEQPRHRVLDTEGRQHGAQGVVDGQDVRQGSPRHEWQDHLSGQAELRQHVEERL